jgi:hypothetical protein
MANDFQIETLDQYEITKLSYPDDLSGKENKYGENKVMFFINVQGGGEISTQGTEETFDLPKYRYLRASGQELKEEFKGVDLKVIKPMRRLASAIALYVPENITKSYGVDWSMESNDSMMTGEILAQSLLAGKKLTANFSRQNAGEAVGDVAKIIGGGLVAKALGGMKYAQRAAGLTPGNSKAQLLFNSVDFGEFTFDYKFAPKSSKEAANVLNIIRTFRHHMLPEFLDAAKFIYIYPSEFEVRYYRGTKENEYLEHHITAVLTNMTVNYTPNGQYSTFDDGMPTHINLTLRFKELGTPSKETSPSNKSGA